MANPRVIPALKYRDALAAIDWLCAAFGFEKRLVVPGPEGSVAHAQLDACGGMVMLSSTSTDEYGSLVVEPESVGGVTQSTYVIVGDADVHHDRATAAGAEVIMPLRDEEHGGRSYLCRDPEGHIWCFGTYDPFLD